MFTDMVTYRTGPSSGNSKAMAVSTTPFGEDSDTDGHFRQRLQDMGTAFRALDPWSLSGAPSSGCRRPLSRPPLALESSADMALGVVRRKAGCGARRPTCAMQCHPGE